MIIAIDGPAGSGKSTVAQKVARSIGFQYINSGNLYRAITWKLIKAGLINSDIASIERAASEIHPVIKNGATYLDGENIVDKLRTIEVDSAVAGISSIREIRNLVNSILRLYAKELNVVVEGRDIGTEVFPNAELKIFLDAKPEARALRRKKQFDMGNNLDAVEMTLVERDEIDKSKSFGALRVARDAFYLDSSDLTLEEVCEKVITRYDQLKGQ